MIKTHHHTHALLLPFLLFTVSCGTQDGARRTIDPQVKSHTNEQDFSSLINAPASTNSKCPDWRSGETIKLSGDITLPKNCAYERVTLKIVSSDVDIHCNNAVFNGLSHLHRNAFNQPYSIENTPQSTGIEIVSSEASGNRLSNISVSNCQFVNYVNGAYIAISLQESTKASLRAKAMDEQLLRDLAPTNIRFKNLTLINSHKHGIFLNRYITNFSVEDSVIKGSGNSGLYLEAGSRSSTVKNNTFEGNGFSSYSRSTRTRTPRTSSKARREAIAVDGSSFNTITGNTFKANGDGGIYLYKNCWEKHKDPRQLPRLEGANDNVIEGNSFTEETVGIWIAERADRNLASFECGDELVHSSLWRKYYRDYASRNIIDNNSFVNNDVGVRVQDDDNAIRNNTFVSTSAGNDIEIGSSIRRATDNPVANITLEGNKLSRQNSVVAIGD